MAKQNILRVIFQLAEDIYHVWQQFMINLSEFIYQDFKIEQADELAAIAMESYEDNNSFSKEGLQTRQELQLRIKVSAKLFLEAQGQFNKKHKTNRPTIKILTHKGKIVAAGMAIDLHIFYQQLLPMMDPQDPYAQFLRCIDPNVFSPGRAVYSSLFVVKKEYLKNGLGMFFAHKAINELKQHGVRFIIGCSTNPISEKIAMKLGASRMKTEEISRNGKTAKAVLLVNQVEVMAKRFKSKL